MPTCSILRGTPYCNLIAVSFCRLWPLIPWQEHPKMVIFLTLLQFLSSLQGNLLKLARPQATSAYSMICGCADWVRRLQVSGWSPAGLQPMSDTRTPAQFIAAGALVMSCHHVQLPLACLLLDSLYHLLVTQFELKWYYGQHPPGRHALNNQINAKPRRARCRSPNDLNHPRSYRSRP